VTPPTARGVTTTRPTDAELLGASREDPQAFRELYNRWSEPLLLYFYRRVFDAEVAGDLVAETFAVALEGRHRFHDLGRSGAAWLFGIARKELSHYFRRRQVELRPARRLGVVVPEMDDESIARVEALVDLESQRPALVSALREMSDGERRAVQLRVIDELDYPTVAVRLGCSEGAARKRVHRGLARLASLLEGTR
jgi:RNA polymerase sigma factor (sigma-70 family)